MPPFNRWRRYWNSNWSRYRRRRFRARRPRKTIRRRFRRRRWVRRRFKNYRKKLKKITVKEWQPKKIRKCTIKGPLCLLACGRFCIANNFTLFAESYIPEKNCGGGAWSIMQLTLQALWDEYVKFRNWWTVSNDGLPLVKYMYCKFKFYRSPHTDYIVIPSLCPPFSVTRDDYLNTQPLRALMNKNKIIVPKLRENSRKKYIKRKFYPPSLYQSKWYFQQEICKFPFIVLKTSACSFDQFYQPDDMLSYNITLYSLSTFFENPRFEEKVADGYSPKIAQGGTLSGQKYYLYGTENGTPNPTWAELVQLTNTQTFTRGTPLGNNKSGTPGNPFHPAWLSEDSNIYYSTQNPSSISHVTKPAENITKLTHMIEKCRYNPLRDAGKGNKVYFKSSTLQQGTMNDLPSNLNTLIEDLPLWIIFWGWISWLRKLHPINHIETEYMFIVKSPYITPARPWYLFLDYYFLQKKHDDPLTETEKAHWFPRYEFQKEVEFYFAQSGPGAPKINYTKCIQVNSMYSFFLKWGGCPAPMETFTNPCDQERFPVPGTVPQPTTIQNPELSKYQYLYEWDEKEGVITKPAAKRIKQDFSPTKYVTDSGAKDVPFQTQTTESDETSTEEETKTSLQNQITLLKLRQRKLKRKLRKHRLI